MRKQAERYRELFEVFRRNKDVVTGVTFGAWPMTGPGRITSRCGGRKDWPLVFDEEHRPKAAFWKIVDF